MPNCIGSSASGGAEDRLDRASRLFLPCRLELGEPLPRLLERRADRGRVLAVLLPLELGLDVAQVELLLVHHAGERVDVLAPVEREQVVLELRVREPLDRVDRREDDDAAERRRELREERPPLEKLVRAAREERLDVVRERRRRDAESLHPAAEE